MGCGLAAKNLLLSARDVDAFVYDGVGKFSRFTWQSGLWWGSFEIEGLGPALGGCVRRRVWGCI